VVHHPEFGEAVIHPIISCIIDGILVYDRNDPPFASFVSLFCPSSESGYSQQWALACMEILRILTLYNRPYKIERSNCEVEKTLKSSSSTCESVLNPPARAERKSTRPLSPWITDILLAAPLGIRSDYFRW
jgi:GIGANTEA protein